MKAMKLAVVALAVASAMYTNNIYAEDDYMKVTLADGSETIYKVSDISEITFFDDNGDEPSTVTVGEAVDLGLSVKWASFNIGADTASDYGGYFAWGETETKEAYNEENSSFFHADYATLKSQGVIDDAGNLTSQYDAATVIWGAGWRMPTLSELQELTDKCTWTWTNKDGHDGYTVAGPNGNSIFLPAAGGMSGSTIYFEGNCGYSWSSTASEYNNYSLRMYYEVTDHKCTLCRREVGQSIRPVKE